MELALALAWVCWGYAVWTLYLDLTVFYGWQQGGYLAKFTHWCYVLNLLFLSVHALCSLARAFGSSVGLGPLALLERALLLTTATVTLHVDASFLMLILPRRFLGLERANQLMSASSAHKHLINAFWVFGCASLSDLPEGGKVNDDEFWLFGNLLPVALAGLYLWFALQISDVQKASRIMRLVGISLPPKPLPAPGTIAIAKLPNITAIPGEWIYTAFRKTPMRVAFLLMPVAFAQLARLFLTIGATLSQGSKSALVLVIGVTSPCIYCLPRILKEKRSDVEKAQ